MADKIDINLFSGDNKEKCTFGKDRLSESALNKDKENELQCRDKEFLIRLLDYFKYLYEEEKVRRDILNDTTKIYLGAFGFVVGIGLIKVETVEKLASLLNSVSGNSYAAILAAILLSVAVVLFIFSFVLTMLTVKMWQRERLCDPQAFLYRAVELFNENFLLSAIIADYAVTTCRNHEINEKKAYLLSNALILFIAAIMVLVIALGIVEAIVKHE